MTMTEVAVKDLQIIRQKSNVCEAFVPNSLLATAMAEVGCNDLSDNRCRKAVRDWLLGEIEREHHLPLVKVGTTPFFKVYEDGARLIFLVY